MTDSDADAVAFAAPPPPAEPSPHPDAVPLTGPGYRQRPADLYRQMRRDHGPVVPILLEGDIPAWYVIGYRELHQVQSDAELFVSDSRVWNAWDRIPPDWPLLPFVAYGPALNYTGGAEHRRRIEAIGDALSTVDQFELTADCERTADSLIDRFAGNGSAELVAEYARPMPALVISRMLGVPDAEMHTLTRDTNIVTDNSADALDAFQRMGATMGRLVADKHQRPGPDVISHLVRHPAGIGHEELAQDLLLMTTASNQTTGNWIANTLHLMLTDDRFAVKMSGGRSSVGEALNEVLWEDTPLQNMLGRWATRATQVGGRQIQAGDLLVLGLAAANSDPQIRPDSHAGTAGNQAHMAFNIGEHACPHPAPEIAEVIAKTAVEVILDRLPDIDLAIPADAVQWRDSLWIRGLTALPVRFTPGHVVGPTEPRG